MHDTATEVRAAREQIQHVFRSFQEEIYHLLAGNGRTLLRTGQQAPVSTLTVAIEVEPLTFSNQNSIFVVSPLTFNIDSDEQVGWAIMPGYDFRIDFPNGSPFADSSFGSTGNLEPYTGSPVPGNYQRGTLYHYTVTVTERGSGNQKHRADPGGIVNQ